MIVKIFIFICSLCVVKAYVAVNVYDRDPDIQTTAQIDLDKSPLISDCSPLGCAQLCQRLGLKGGVCVNGRCKCDLFKGLEDRDIQATSQIDLDKSPLISDCSPLGCAQLCQRIGLKGGVCVHGMCKCDLFIALDGDTQESLTVCDWSSCNRGCRSIGYPGGFCVGSECRCNPRPYEAESNNRTDNVDGEIQVMALEKPSPIYNDCNPLACEQMCRRIFLKGGACVNGRCKCDIMVDSEETKVELKEKPSTQTCITSKCVLMCRAIGFISGMCDGFKNTCKCY